MIADRLRQETWFKMATDSVIDLALEATQVDRLGRNAAATGCVPRRDKLPRIRTSFDYDENLIHTHQYRPQPITSSHVSLSDAGKPFQDGPGNYEFLQNVSEPAR